MIIDTRADCESVTRIRRCISCKYQFKTLEYEAVYVEDRSKDYDKD